MKLFLSHSDIINIYNIFNYTSPKLKERYPYDDICTKKILITGKKSKIIVNKNINSKLHNNVSSQIKNKNKNKKKENILIF